MTQALPQCRCFARFGCASLDTGDGPDSMPAMPLPTVREARILIAAALCGTRQYTAHLDRPCEVVFTLSYASPNELKAAIQTAANKLIETGFTCVRYTQPVQGPGHWLLGYITVDVGIEH